MKKLLFSSAIGGALLFLIGIVGKNFGIKLGSTEVTVIFFVGVFIGRFLFSVLFLVMVDYKSIVIDESRKIIEFTFQLGISKDYRVISGFTTNIDISNPQELSPFITSNAKRADFKRLLIHEEIKQMEISNGNKKLQLLNPRLKN
jgi:hypothetical protein